MPLPNPSARRLPSPVSSFCQVGFSLRLPRTRLTAAAERALDTAASWHRPSTRGNDRAVQEVVRWGAPELLLGLLAESECGAAQLLAGVGVDKNCVCQRWPDLQPVGADSLASEPLPEIQQTFQTIQDWMADHPGVWELSTEHLLWGLQAADHQTSLWLGQLGLAAAPIEAVIRQRFGGPPTVDAPLDWPPPDESAISGQASLKPVTPELVTPEIVTPELVTNEPKPVESQRNDQTFSGQGVGLTPAVSQCAEASAQAPWQRLSVGVWRLLDASINRAREALRVLEDYVRFILDDQHLTACLKHLRHDLTGAFQAVPREVRLACRETLADVGTTLQTPNEGARKDEDEVIAANFARLSESLRSIEEFFKLFSGTLAATVEKARYTVYTLERSVGTTRQGLPCDDAHAQRPQLPDSLFAGSLAMARVYVLVPGCEDSAAFETLVNQLTGAGVDILQLRDKHLPDRQLLCRARLLTQLTAKTQTLAVINDRPDIAVLADADGVHIGQDELTVKDARAIVGPKRFIGVSTHSVDQARQAVLDGANYLGVGPTFPSQTKDFQEFPGLNLIRQICSQIRLPIFAIGGITPDNLPEVIEAGAQRVAVGASVVATPDPAAAVREFALQLSRNAPWPSSQASPKHGILRA